MQDWSDIECFINNKDIIFGLGNQEMLLSSVSGLLERIVNIPYTNAFDWDGFYKIENEYLETAGQMFIYWNLCPKFMYDWTQFYTDLMQNAQLDIIIQTLNRIMVTAKTSGDKAILDIAKKIFARITESDNLPFQLKKIDALSKTSQQTTNNYNWSQGLLLSIIK